MRATTYEEVSSGALNSPEDRFDIAIGSTLTSLRELRRDGQLVGGMLFGSAFTGDLFHKPDCGPLSDLDVLAVTPDHYYGEGSILLGEMAARVLGRSAVSLEVTWITERQAGEDTHTITEPMHSWLRRQVSLHPEAVVGKNPTELIQPLQVDLNDYTDEWFRATRNRFQKASFAAHQALPWALDLPHIAARRSIDVLKHTNRAGQSVGMPLGVTREEIRLAVQDVYGQHDPKIWELYQRTDARKRDYLSFLTDEVSMGKVSKSEYDATISQMAREVVSEVLELVIRMHEAFNSVGHPIYDDAYFARVAEINMRTRV